jgi:hypothetical protein
MLSPLEGGRAQGKLALTSFEKPELRRLLEMEPEIMRKLEELQREVRDRNWRVEYVDHVAKSTGEIDINDIEYQLMPWSIFKGSYSIMIDVGMVLPIVKETRMHKLIYNIQTDRMKYDNVSIDLVRKEITHVNNVFWNWEEEWKENPEKLLEASETLKVLRWLIEEKGYSLGGEYDPRRCQKMCGALEKLLEERQVYV